MENLLSNLSLFVEEDDELVVGEEIDDEVGGDIQLYLVGKLLAEQSLNFSIIQTRLANIWKPGRGVMIKDIGSGQIQI
ncbi:hypothetical protein ACS0TY_013453 [Phlomoides rotata]